MYRCIASQRRELAGELCGADGRVTPLGVPWAALPVQRCLSNAASLVVYACFVVSRSTIMCNTIHHC